MMPQRNSTWSEDVSAPVCKALMENMTTDVVIVGGGIAGIISAYLLAKEGKKVVVVEKGKIGAGATYLTTAFLTQSVDTDYVDLKSAFNFSGARTVADSHNAAIKCIEKIIKDERIECDFERCSNYTYAVSEKDFETLEDEADMQEKLGMNVSVVKKGSKLGFPNSGYIELKQQAKFHPLKFLYALSERLPELGVTIYENTEAVSVKEEGKNVKVKTKGGTLTASHAVIATYEPFTKPLRLYFKKAFYISYVLELEIPKGSIPYGTYEDTVDPYHYIRVDSNGEYDRAIIGGEDHRQDIKVNPKKSFKALHDYADTLFASIAHRTVREWKGPILEPVDGLALIGPLSDKRIFYMMAFSGNGMTYSAIAAIIVKDYILGIKNPWAKLYAATRTPGLKALMVKGRDYSKELAGAAIKNTIKYRA